MTSFDHLLALKVPKGLKKWLESYDSISGLWNPSAGKLCGDIVPSVSRKLHPTKKKTSTKNKLGMHQQGNPNPKTQDPYPPATRKRN